MQAINVVKNQGICDILLQSYGTVNALPELIANNIFGDFILDAMITPGSQLLYNTESAVTEKKKLKKLGGRYIRTYRVAAADLNGLMTEDSFIITTEDGQNIIP